MWMHITIDTKPDGTPTTILQVAMESRPHLVYLEGDLPIEVSCLQDLTIGALYMLPVRPMKSPELIDTVVQAYRLTSNGDPIDLGGSSNLNLLFKRGELGYVARIYRAWKGSSPSGPLFVPQGCLSPRPSPRLIGACFSLSQTGWSRSSHS
jgi:hypothetical protein